jgi:hypothetical protein
MPAWRLPRLTWQSGQVKDLIWALQGASFQRVTEGTGGTSTEFFGLLDAGWVFLPRDDGTITGRVTFSEFMAREIRASNIAYLDNQTLYELVRRDGLAAVLWVFLETDKMPWRYPLFSLPPGQPSQVVAKLAIADLLGVSRWKRR